MNRARHAFHAAPVSASPIAARAAWRAVLAQAATLANRVREGGLVDKVDGPVFAGAVIRLKAPFPLRHPSAGTAAEAFLMLCRAFIANRWPVSLAAFVGEGAACLEAMLDADAMAAAAEGRRRLGESDD